VAIGCVGIGVLPDACRQMGYGDDRACRLGGHLELDRNEVLPARLAKNQLVSQAIFHQVLAQALAEPRGHVRLRLA